MLGKKPFFKFRQKGIWQLFLRMIRCAALQIHKRFKTDFILAKYKNGKLSPAQFDNLDRKFCFSPRISAFAKVNGFETLLSIGGIYKLEKENEIGPFINIDQTRQPWRGFLNAEIDIKNRFDSETILKTKQVATILVR